MLICVDVEADGPYPPDYSLISIGAVVVTKTLDQTFFCDMAPISPLFNIEDAAISNTTREKHLLMENPLYAMKRFTDWVRLIKKPVFISDNPAFDWMWINYYCWKFTGSNPFGWSARRAGDLWCGMEKNMYAKWKHLRTTPHTHNPVDDAKGVAEALLKMNELGLKGIL